jgi:hypothetical protein
LAAFAAAVFLVALFSSDPSRHTAEDFTAVKAGEIKK